MTKAEQAAEFLRTAEACGCVATVENGWVKFTPALPPFLLAEAAFLGAELAKAVS
jgi:hypothetical protein